MRQLFHFYFLSFSLEHNLSSLTPELSPRRLQTGWNLNDDMRHHQNPSSSQTLVHSPLGLVYVLMLGFPGGSAVKNPPAMQETAGSIPRWGRSPGGGHGIALQYSCLENRMDRGAWGATVHRATKSRLWQQAHMSWCSSFLCCISLQRGFSVHIVSEADLSPESCRHVSSCLNPRHYWVIIIIHLFIQQTFFSACFYQRLY